MPGEIWAYIIYRLVKYYNNLGRGLVMLLEFQTSFLCAFYVFCCTNILKMYIKLLPERKEVN